MGFLSRLFGRDKPKRVAIDLPSRDQLEASHLSELHGYAAKAGIDRYRLMRKEALVGALLERSGQSNGAADAAVAEPVAAPAAPRRPQRESRPQRPARKRQQEPAARSTVEEPASAEPEPETHAVSGFVDLTRRGHGFLRVDGLTRSPDDPYLSRSQVRKFDLRPGDQLSGSARSARRSERYPSLVQIDSIDGEAARQRDRATTFDDMTAVRPDRGFALATGPSDRQGRMLEVMAPFGPGQRVLVGAPPGAGATSLLRGLASALGKSGDVEVIVALVDSRPEERADWSIDGVDVYSSPADSRQAAHLGLAELAIERAKRRAEAGRDAVVMIDSATRLARAYEAASRNGRTRDEAQGGAESVKRLFAFSRNAEGSGSVTILMTARTDADETVYKSLADIANAEILLDAELARSGKFPAVDLDRTHARSDEGLVPSQNQHRLSALRSVVRSLEPAEAWDFLAEKLDESDSTDQLLRD